MSKIDPIQKSLKESNHPNQVRRRKAAVKREREQMVKSQDISAEAYHKNKPLESKIKKKFRDGFKNIHCFEILSVGVNFGCSRKTFKIKTTFSYHVKYRGIRIHRAREIHDMDDVQIEIWRLWQTLDAWSKVHPEKSKGKL